MDPVNVPAKLEVHTSPIPEIRNSDWSFGWRVNSNLGEEEVVGGHGSYRLRERR